MIFLGAHSLGKDLKAMLVPPATGSWVIGHALLFLTYLLPAVPIVYI
jgi:hypothetical protein